MPLFCSYLTRVLGELKTMERSQIKLSSPASESQKGAVLAVCLVVMSVMCIALIWQAQIIANQREAIQWLERFKFGG